MFFWALVYYFLQKLLQLNKSLKTTNQPCSRIFLKPLTHIAHAAHLALVVSGVTGPERRSGSEVAWRDNRKPH